MCRKLKIFKCQIEAVLPAEVTEDDFERFVYEELADIPFNNNSTKAGRVLIYDNIGCDPFNVSNIEITDSK